MSRNVEEMSLADIRIAIAETEAKIANLNRQHAQNLHAIADQYAEIADNIDSPDYEDILAEFVKHHGGNAKVGRSRAISHFRQAAKDKRALAAEPLSLQVALSSPGYAKAPAPVDDPWMKKLLGQE
jgi:hypothetical protein